MKRHKAVEIIDEIIGDDTLCIFSNGQIGREAYVYNDRKRNFYMLSSMGKAAAIGLGVALAKPNRDVVVVEGDGNALMGLDAFAMVGYSKPRNFTHIVLDNREHATTGGQKTHTTHIDLSKIARGAGYDNVQIVDSEEALCNALRDRCDVGKPYFILAIIEKGNTVVSRKARQAPEMIRDHFMEAAAQ